MRTQSYPSDITDAQWAFIEPPEGTEGWVKLPIRWTVERTFA
jgi:hypothetical protein